MNTNFSNRSALYGAVAWVAAVGLAGFATTADAIPVFVPPPSASVSTSGSGSTYD